jgi:hypothetical protein
MARFAFYAARALEIYTLDDLSAEIRYDYGFVHPDIDRDFVYGRLTESQYALAYQTAWSSVPTVLNYRQRYLDYFTSSAADFTRDVYLRSIKDPLVLADFKEQHTLDISVDLTDTELFGRAEAKVEVVGVALIGAKSSNAFVACAVQHGGNSAQRKVDGNIVTQYLRPHATIIQSKFQPLASSDVIPDPHVDPLTAPRTIEFWGRGVATTWRLTVEDPDVDLSAVSEIQFAIGYVAFLAPDVEFVSPIPEAEVANFVPLTAHATRVSNVKFIGYYADDPTDVNTAHWHDIGGGTLMTPDQWTLNWDTSNVPDHGNASWGTINIGAVALDANGNDLNVTKYCRIDVKNE